MSIEPSAHLAVGTGTQVGILTLWTKKEHVMAKVPKQLYAVCAQLYSRDEGISKLVRSLLANKQIRDIVCVGADLNRCLPTLKALWENGAHNGEVIGAPGYVDVEVDEAAIDRLREHVTIHDLSHVKEYEEVASYIEGLEPKPSWGEAEEFPEAKIQTPDEFPYAPVHTIIHVSAHDAAIDLARRMQRFGDLQNVRVVISRLPFPDSTTKNAVESCSLSDIPSFPVDMDSVNIIDIDLLQADNSVQEFSQKRISRFTHGDPASNFLIRLGGGKITVMHLGPDGKRLESFSDDSAQRLYKKIVSEFRVSDVSHAAYLGYELARAEHALKSGELYEQDQL